MTVAFSKSPPWVTFFAERKIFKECTSTEMKYTVLSSEKVDYKFFFMVKPHEMNYEK